MLDDFDSIVSLDSQEFFRSLKALPNSYDGPEGLQAEPYGLIAYGEASHIPELAKSWLDAKTVVSGTQFLFAGGFDYGEAATMKLSSELAGANVITLGHGIHEPSFEVDADVLSTYTYMGYLAHATGHKEDWLEANTIMASLSEKLQLDVKTEENPAKTLAWSLWNRVPLLLSSSRQYGLTLTVQKVLARVAKSLAITMPEHPLEVMSGAFEARHQLADDLVALRLGDADEELSVAEEVLASRVAQQESLSLPFAGFGYAPVDLGAHNIVIWYISLWVAAYLAILNKLDPADSSVYNAIRGFEPPEEASDDDQQDDLDLN